tara:strand:- start:1734 stop:2225 length:492 start_codon:yes stop_codon:yes gene_type:complete
MPNVTVYQYFTFTDDAGNEYKDGSLTAGQTITAATGEVFDRTYDVAQNTIKEILNDDLIADFDFLFISADADSEIMMLCTDGGNLSGGNIENGFCLKLTANVPFILSRDDARNMGNMDGGFSESNYNAELETWETNWVADDIDRIEFYCTGSGGAKVRVFAVT